MNHSDEVPATGGQDRRRFHLWDAMILVAAMAVGLAIARVALSQGYPRRLISPRDHLLYAIERGHAAVFSCVAALTAAFLPLRLRRPIPAFPRVCTQPGFVACCIAIVQLMEGAVIASFAETAPHTFALALSPAIGISVAGAWLILWFNGWWKAEPGWNDAMGRVLGVCWIVMPVVLYSAFVFA